MTTTDNEVIRTENLTKLYPGMDVAAVDGLNLTVFQGEIFGLLGPNGAGKTTTAGILTTRVVPTSGHAFVAGIDVRQHPALVKQVSGIVSQQNTLDRQLTVWENLYFHGRLFGTASKGVCVGPVRRTARAALAVESGPRPRSTHSRAGWPSVSWSLARSSTNPAVLFLDEPTAGLDPQSRLALWEMLSSLTICRSNGGPDDALHGRGRPAVQREWRSWTTARCSPSTRPPI